MLPLLPLLLRSFMFVVIAALIFLSTQYFRSLAICKFYRQIKKKHRESVFDVILISTCHKQTDFFVAFGSSELVALCPASAQPSTRFICSFFCSLAFGFSSHFYVFSIHFCHSRIFLVDFYYFSQVFFTMHFFRPGFYFFPFLLGKEMFCCKNTNDKIFMGTDEPRK